MNKYQALMIANESMNAGNIPRVHPNGFIQLDLSDDGNKRLHVWRNDLPRQKVYTPVHNHRFDFKSITVAGALTNMTFEFANPDQGPAHRLWLVMRDTESQETKLIPTVQVVGLIATKLALMKPGEGYEFKAGAFHETSFVHNTVTIIDKSNPIPEIESTVLVPEGIKPDNTFNRAVPNTDMLKNIIYEALV